MNLDLVVHRMALRQTDSLGVAQLLVVKNRIDVEMEELRQQANGTATGQAVRTERAIASVEAAVELTARVDKTA